MMSIPALALRASIATPVLYLDFTRGNLDSRITFTRIGSTATRVNASGLIETVPADTPRFDYDPVTLTRRGLLVESGSTNPVLYSGDLSNVVWLPTIGGTGSIPTRTANYATAPDGTMTATRIQLALNGGTSVLDQSIIGQVTGTSGPFDSIGSFYIRTNDGSTRNIYLQGTSGSTVVTVTSTFARYSFAAGSFVVAGFLGIGLRGGQSTACSDSADLVVWGAQSEAANLTSATSYMPTSAVPGGRSSDSAIITGANFSSWYNATAGSILAEGSSNSSMAPYLVSINDNTNNYAIRLALASFSTAYTVIDGGSSQVSLGAAVSTAKYAAAYAVNDFAISIGGGSVAIDSSGTVPTVNQMNIGTGAGGANIINGLVKRIYYYPRRLTNAELQSLSH